MKNLPLPLVVIGLCTIALAIVAITLYQNRPASKDNFGNLGGGGTVVEADAPSITHVRVSPDGIAVLSGNAAASMRLAIVTADDGNKQRTLATTQADAHGNWVAVPEAALGAGDHLLVVVGEDEDANPIISNMAVVVTIVANRRDPPLVALVPYGEAAGNEVRILQSPFAGEAATDFAAASNAPRVTIRSISVTDDDRLLITGEAFAAGTVIVHAKPNTDGFAIVQDADVTREVAASIAAGRVQANRHANGYTATTPIPMRLTSRFDVAVILQGADGQTIAQNGVSLTYDKLAAVAEAGELIVIQKGDMLWRIAYKTYGQGLRFVDIYNANRADIGDPDLIFPDQVFVVPAE